MPAATLTPEEQSELNHVAALCGFDAATINATRDHLLAFLAFAAEISERCTFTVIEAPDWPMVERLQRSLTRSAVDTLNKAEGLPLPLLTARLKQAVTTIQQSFARVKVV